MSAHRSILLIYPLVVLASLLLVGFTWQLLPALVAGLLGLLAWWRLKRGRGWVHALVLLLLGLSGLAFWAFPLVFFPPPSGPYAVGVRYQTISTLRPETMTANPKDTRTIYLKIWYPAARITEAERNPYLEGGKKTFQLLLRGLPLPAAFFAHFDHINTHGYTNAPPAKGPFPLLTFSHGYGSWFGQNTPLCAELASRGYIVASIAHSHQTMFAATSPQEIVTFPQVVPLQGSEQEDEEENTFETFIRTRDRSAYTRQFYAHLQADSAIHTFARIWAADIAATITALTAPAAPSALRVDTTKIGAWGMSFGGAAAAEAALTDKRVKAAINLDGTQFGSWVQDTMRRPVLMLEAVRSPHLYSMHAPLQWRTTAPYHVLLFKDAAHYNFTDVNLFSPLFRYLGLTGRVRGHAMITALNRVVPAFFDAALAGKPFQPRVFHTQQILPPKF